MNPNDVGKKKIMRKEKERDFKNSLKTETYCNMRETEQKSKKWNHRHYPIAEIFLITPRGFIFHSSNFSQNRG